MPRPLFEVTDLRVAVQDKDRAVRGVPGPYTESFEQLPDGWVEVIPGASFSVDEGEVLAIIGESASGKSLLLMGAFGLLAPGSRVIGGDVRYRDASYKPGGIVKDPQKRTRRERREASRAGTVTAEFDQPEWPKIIGSEVGFIFQNPIGALAPQHVVGAQTGEALEVHSDLTHEEIEARVYDALGEVKLPTSKRFFGAYRHQLSRGMAQRTMLAAALTKAPKLLIADEPLNGLDTSVAAAIMELIRDMQRKRAMAMVIVAHDLAAVASLADRVAVVYGGEIIEVAPAAELYHHPQHPYTSGLIGSIPGLGGERLRPIPGESPALIDVDHSRCVFADRCEHATGICTATPPVLERVGGSTVACHHAAVLDLPGIRR